MLEHFNEFVSSVVLYRSLSIIRPCWVECERRNACRILVRKHFEKWLLGGPKRRWEDNIKMELR
jgi:hypothetical protein